MTETSATRTVTIDGMVGDACVQNVKSALGSVEHVSTQSVALGVATIHADPQGSDAACRAIDSAGYHAHESKDVSKPAHSPPTTSDVSASITAAQRPSHAAPGHPTHPRSKYTNTQRPAAPDHAS